MTRAQVRTFVETGINDISSAIGFSSGRISEFVSKMGKENTFCWLESLSNSPEIINGSTPFDNWNIAIHIAKKNALDTSNDDYETTIDECDNIAQKLQYKYNQSVSGFALVKLLNISREPFIKKHGNPIQSGVILSFVLNGPDTTDIC